MNCPFYVNRWRRRQSALFSINLEGDKITMAKANCAPGLVTSHLADRMVALNHVLQRRHHEKGTGTMSDAASGKKSHSPLCRSCAML